MCFDTTLLIISESPARACSLSAQPVQGHFMWRVHWLALRSPLFLEIPGAKHLLWRNKLTDLKTSPLIDTVTFVPRLLRLSKGYGFRPPIQSLCHGVVRGNKR